MNKILKKRTANTCNLWIFIGAIIVIICTPLEVFGQSGDNESLNIQNVALPSPTAASIKKFEDYPISYATGVPQISIPLYVASSRKLSIPISLSYHASGIRVEEVPGWVGSGWSLNAGGAIVRTVRGLPDEQTNGYLEEGEQAHSFNTGSGSDQYKFDVATGTVDAEPDDYSISAPGLSGKFTFKYDGTIVMLPHQNLKIEADLTSISNDIAKFTITKEDGTVYTFAEKEETYMVSINKSGGDMGYVSPKTYTSSWYLTKIESPYGDDEIILSYENSGITTEQTVTISTNRTDNLIYMTCTDSVNDNDIKNTNRTYNRFLKTITTPTEKIHFNRDDTFGLSTKTRLESILVETKNEATRLRKFVMDTDTVGNRLTLVSVQEFGLTDSEALPAYELDYYDTYTLPAFNSYAIDHWGYYNGETSNDTYIPQVYVTEESESLAGADRDPVFAYAVTGSLKKITLPSGGNTSFVYELNDYYKNVSAKKEPGGGIRIKSVTTHDGISSANDVVRTYTYLNQNDASKSSGYLTGGPIELYEHTPVDGSNPCPYVVRNSKASGLIGGPPVAYTDVQEYLGTVSTNEGYSKFELQYSLHSGRDDKTWKRGRVKEIEQFKSDDTIVQHQVNTYNFSANEVDTSYAVEVNVVWVNPTTGIDTSYSTKKIPFNSYTQYKSKQTNEVFDALGVNSFTTVEDYIYDYNSSDKILKLNELKQTNSDGSIRKQIFRYGYEEYSGMKTANMLSQPYSVALTDNSGDTLSKKWSIWSDSVAGNSNWNVKEQWQWEGSNISDVTVSEDPDSEALLMNRVNAYDAYANPLEIEDNAGTKTAYDWSEDGTVPIGIFQNADKDNVFAHSFAKDRTNGWNFIDVEEDLDTDTSIVDGKLKLTNYGSAENIELDRIYYDHGTEITNIIVWEFDIKIDDSDGSDLQINTGNSTWDGGSTDNAVWSAIKNEVWRTHDGNDWVPIKAGLIVGRTYTFKIVMNPVLDKADYYVDGVLLEKNISFRDASVSGIQKFAFGNYGYGTVTTEWLIDNVRIYPEDAQAVSQEVDPLFRTPLAMKDAAGSTNRFTYDEFGRLSETFNPNGERLSRNVYFYSLDDHASFDDEDPNRVESITYNDPADTTDKTISVGYLDGLGRSIQSQVRGGSSTIITDTRYNERGLPEVTSRPFKLSNQTTYLANAFEGSGSFIPGDTLHATSEIENEYESLPDSDGRYAYTYSKFESSPLARQSYIRLPGYDNAIKDSVTTVEYSINEDSREEFKIVVSGGTKTWGVNKLRKSVTKDPSGKKTITYTDGWGQTIASGVDMNGDNILNGSTKDTCTNPSPPAAQTCDLITEFDYDLRGNLIKVEDPRGLQTTYTYNQKGELTSKKLPDQEYSESYRYDEKGRLRFTQDPNQKSTELDLSTNLSGNNTVTKTLEVTSKGVLSYSIYIFDLFMDGYDVKIKHVENGNSVIHSNSASSDDELTGSIVVDPGTYVFYGNTQDEDEPIAGTNGTYSFSSYDIYTYTKYDELDRPVETGEYAGTTSFMSANPDNDTFPTTGNDPSIQYYYDGDHTAFSPSYIPDNAKGKLTKVSYRDLSSVSGWGHDWFSYNNLGLVEWKITQPAFLSTPKLIEYDYDELGRLTESRYQPTNSEKFFQRYSYDALGRMNKVETSTNGSTWIKDAEYTSFLADGEVGQLKLGNTDIQKVDYSYTVQGWLEKINNGSISTGSKGDRFGMNLDYDFNGNINLQEWRQEGVSGTDTMSYNYTYDNANRLSSANNGDSSYCTGFSCSFDVNYTYDKNGNITDIVRHTDLYGYNFDTYSAKNYNDYNIQFETNTNRIDSLNHIENVDGSSTDHGGLQVTYDANGNMISNEMQGFSSVDYDWRNLPAQMIVGANTLQYAYDAEGNRVKKKVVSGVETHYVRGAGGETIAIYQADTLLFHNILAGADIIGNHKNGARKYFLKDHLGSVRTTVDESGVVVGYSDYYPFGLLMPTRNGRSGSLTEEADKYKFTGHERDVEADLTLDYMMARNYDPIIGRFLQIDPHFSSYPSWSPYTYTFNNPMLFTDPTGMDPVCKTIKVKNTYKACIDTNPKPSSKIENTKRNITSLVNVGKIGYEIAWVSVEKVYDLITESDAQFELNKQLGAEAEDLVTTELESDAHVTVLNQVTGEFEDGSTVRFDNVVLDEEGKVILVNETKYNNAKLSSQQKRFFKGGESVLLKGKNAEGASGTLVNPNKTQIQERRVSPDELEVRIYINDKGDLILDINNVEIKLLSSTYAG